MGTNTPFMNELGPKYGCITSTVSWSNNRPFEASTVSYTTVNVGVDPIPSINTGVTTPVLRTLTLLDI